MIAFDPACHRGRENRVAFGNDRRLRRLRQGRRVKPMQGCMGEPEDAGPAMVCSAIRGCGGLEAVI